MAKSWDDLEKGLPRVFGCQECDRLIETPVMEDAGQCCRLSVALGLMEFVDTREIFSTPPDETTPQYIRRLERQFGFHLDDIGRASVRRMITATYLAEMLSVEYALILRGSE